ncbi:beta-glucosidase [Nonomuraea turkmeniaca]|uniref:Beta-glucosidase n=1 Tax=Nonomuraea turkmeniaca TaxID=103838 RepID=A0A5S4FH60_9ACTN|nr:GH1 family beta-glucosidase [Nonomuraea turkmeniaca]TMR19202.1 beta-glucosidase [Nonomuraea turkmeniaca]
MSFPDGFLWGAGTSAYQIEGHHGRGESVWDEFCRRPGAIEGGGDGSRACDSFLRWQEDIELIKELGLGAYRFSTGWSRVMPDGVHADPKALDHYERFVDALLEAGTEPVLTLNHWDMPAALTWAQRSTVHAFAAYAEAVAGRLADRVTWWITQNEPWIIALLGYQLGLHAPGVADLGTAVRAGHHVLLGHGAAADVLRTFPGAQAGCALSLFPCDPATDSEADWAAAAGSDGYVNRWYLDPLLGDGYPADTHEHWERALGRRDGQGLDFIRDGDEAAIGGRSDFLGINYYTRRVMAAAPPDPFPWRVVGPSGDVARTDEGWEINADALRDLLIGLSRRFPGTPLLVTENGGVFGDAPTHDGLIHDNRRIAFLRDHVEAVRAALAAGADVRGYLHWSLMDNFEWALGYRPRFGLVHVDYATGVRTIKDSGRYYAQLIAGGGTVPDLPRIEAFG